jgi:toxin ParE1/3/4
VAADRHLQFLPAARSELIEAALRYEQEQEGLGARFVETVGRAAAGVLAEPERWPMVPRVAPNRGARRRLLRAFPYAIVYRILSTKAIEVVALAHQKRRPGYWAKR